MTPKIDADIMGVAITVHEERGIKHMKANGEYLYMYNGDTSATTALGASAHWPVIAAGGSKLTRPCMDSSRRLATIEEVDTSKCGANDMETYMVEITYDSPDKRGFDKILTNTENKDPSLYANASEIRNGNGDPVYVCATPSVTSAEQVIYDAPNPPPASPPPSPPRLEIQMVHLDDSGFVGYINHDRDYSVFYSGTSTEMDMFDYIAVSMLFGGCSGGLNGNLRGAAIIAHKAPTPPPTRNQTM